MDVSADKAVAQRPHGVAQDVPADGLHDVLHEFRAVAFDPLPFFRRTDAFIGDRFATEFVLADLWFHICQPPAGWKLDEQHGALVDKPDAVCFCDRPPSDRGLHGIIHIPPEGDDVRIGLPMCPD